jgi:hypothetical protein
MKLKPWQKTLICLAMSVSAFSVVLNRLSTQTSKSNQYEAKVHSQQIAQINLKNTISYDQKVLFQLQYTLKKTDDQTKTAQMATNNIDNQIRELNRHIDQLKRNTLSAKTNSPVITYTTTSTSSSPVSNQVQVPTLPPPPPVQSTTRAS